VDQKNSELKTPTSKIQVCACLGTLTTTSYPRIIVIPFSKNNGSGGKLQTLISEGIPNRKSPSENGMSSTSEIGEFFL
jgi:hypothetical protein